MAEYINREAAKKEFNLNFGGVSHAVIANRLLDSIPAADVVEVVEVVRCRDCKHSTEPQSDRTCWCKGWNQYVPEEHFCSFGKRRDTDG